MIKHNTVCNLPSGEMLRMIERYHTWNGKTMQNPLQRCGYVQSPIRSPFCVAVRYVGSNQLYTVATGR